MNSDVEKAVALAEVRNEMRGDSGRYPNGEGWGRCYRVDGYWLPKDAWQTIRQALRDQEAEIARLHESTHYANGVADLAMKHRDAAEQRAEKADALLRKCRDEFNAMPKSLAYDLTLVREITAHLGGEHE